MSQYTRRDFVTHTAATSAALWAATHAPLAAAKGKLGAVYDEIERRHDETVARLQAWIKQPSVSAENIGMQEGAELMKKLALDAGFQHAEIVPTKGHPSVFATLDAGAKETLASTSCTTSSRSTPPNGARHPGTRGSSTRPDLGKVMIGRAATNQKGPQAAFLAAMHAIRGAGKKIPVNLVLVAEGEEEVGSPNFAQVCHDTPQVRAALEKCIGIFMPSHSQESDGSVAITLGSKGDIEWTWLRAARNGAAARRATCTRAAAAIDQPAWQLVHALNTLVTPNGDPAIDGFFEHVRPVSAEERAMIDIMAKRMDEKSAMADIGAKVWARNADWRQSIEDLVSRPTVTIEGLVGGYGGPGGKTILPHRMTAKIDMRLVPDMTPEDIMAKLRAHLDKRGFGDIEIVKHGGFNYVSSTPADSKLIQVERRRLPELRHRPDDAAALWRLMAGLRVHRGAAQAARRTFRPRLR